MDDFERTLNQIITFNHAWKQARENYSEKSSITNALRNRKSCLQASLLRNFPSRCYLKHDEDNLDGEMLYSIRLIEAVTLPTGLVRKDAEHLPVRLAEELFTAEELQKLIK